MRHAIPLVAACLILSACGSNSSPPAQGNDQTGALDNAALQGVEHLGHFVVTGTVHGTVGNGATHTDGVGNTTYSTAADVIVIGNESGSDVAFNFAHYDGAPNAVVDSIDRMAGYASAGVQLNGGVQVP